MQPLALLTASLLATPCLVTQSQDGASSAPAELPQGPLERDTTQRLEYLSDFFVFVGRDSEGKGLVLAFDANRGRDKESFAAEHFVVLWVEGRGWVDLDATKSLPGSRDHFAAAFGAPLPTGDRAVVTGTAVTGLTLDVPKVALTLRAAPWVVETDRRLARDAFVTGASTGTVTFGERTFAGVVHAEFTYLAGINPLAKTYTDLFGDGFHGVYALVGERAAMRQHRSGGRLEPLIGRRQGYLVQDPAVRGANALPFFDFDTAKKSLGGLFRWPGRYVSKWKVEAEGATREVRVQVDLKERETLINYVFGGVAIAIAKGELVDGDTKQPVLGFALIVL